MVDQKHLGRIGNREDNSGSVSYTARERGREYVYGSAGPATGSYTALEIHCGSARMDQYRSVVRPSPRGRFYDCIVQPSQLGRGSGIQIALQYEMGCFSAEFETAC